MPTLTKKQKQILDFVKVFIKKNGLSPTFEEIGRYTKKTFSTVHEHVEALITKGFLSKINNSSRGIQLIEQSEMVKIPLLGTIAAGQPIEAMQVKEVIAVAKNLLPRQGSFFALKVAGDSMIDENINDGDYVIIKQQSNAENGQKVVALIDNNEATLKKIYKEKNRVRLQPANKNLTPFIFNSSRVAVQGIVIDVIKNPTSHTNITFKEEKQVTSTDRAIYKFEDLKNILGKPYFETANCLIYNMDCINAMQKIKNSVIDLTVTSPPYNIGKEYESTIPVNEYVNWCKQWMNEIYRITNESGAFWLNLGYLEFPEKAKALPITYLLWDKSPFYLVQEVIWNYGAGVAAKKFLSPRNEKLLWYTKNPENYLFNLDDIRDKNVKYPNQKKNGKLRCNPLGKNPSDVWQIPKVTSGENRSSKERTEHPAQFPEALINRIILAASNKNDVVLDPFLGSGTTAITALKNERKMIGFEISENYCKIAKQRILALLESQKQNKLI